MVGRTVKVIFGYYEGLYGVVESERSDSVQIKLSLMCYVNTGMSHICASKSEVKFID